ncbi:hypothetical protein VB735_03780 [Halotia wernerae UHCC 0503]|nr:hypothetical protein [Halotia wernerae UHCC 0503]
MTVNIFVYLLIRIKVIFITFIMAMRDADKDRRKNRPVNNPQSPAKEPLSYHELNDKWRNARADAIQWEQRAKRYEEAASQLTQVQQDIQTYQVKVNELEKRAADNYLIYLDEQKNYQQALCLYNEEQTKVTALITQRDEWQQRAKENQDAASQLTQIQQDIQTYQANVNELEKRAADNYLIYLDEQENYQQALNRYNEAKAKATELIAQRDEWQQRAK